MLDNSLENVVHAIFAECDKNKCNSVQVAEVINFITPFLQPNVSELLELEDALKDNSDNSGMISRSLFTETMTVWTAKYKDCTGQLEDSFDGMLPGRKSDINEKSFVHSTPRTSLGILNQDAPLIQESLTSLNISSASCPDVRLNRTLLEDRLRDLEHTNWRLTEANRKQKAQEQLHEDIIDGLKRDLDLMTNKYNLAQKLIDTFNKVEDSRNDSSYNEASEENSQIDLEIKFKTLQKNFDMTKMDFSKQVDELEFEKLQLEQKIGDLEQTICELKDSVKNMESKITNKNNNLEIQIKENEALLATNKHLTLNVTELTTIIETFKSQQKKMEKNLRKSLCYNDKLQTSFNALQAVKAIGEYSKSKQVNNLSKPVDDADKASSTSAKEVLKPTETLFSPPFKNTKFNFYNINSPKIRKSPNKDKISMSMMETSKDYQKESSKIVKDDAKLLNYSSPPVMYVVHQTPPIQNVINNTSFDYSEISYDEDAKFSLLEPRSPHMSIRTEMQEALSCCCEDIKQSFESQISVLKGDIQTIATEKDQIQKELSEYTKLVQLLEDDKARNVTSLRNLELEVQSLKCKEFETNRKDCTNFAPVRQKDTFNKLKMKLEKYENLLEAKQIDLDNVKTACDVYKARLTENDELVNNMYLNRNSLSKLVRTMNEDLQSQMCSFLEICQEEISNSPKVMELLYSAIESPKDDLNELSTGLLDFSKRISAITEVLRILADSKLELNATIAAFQQNKPVAVNINSQRFACDSPDSPSTNTLHIFNTENQQDCTVLAEPRANMDENISGEENKNTSLINSPIKVETSNVATQTMFSPKLRTNGATYPSMGILLAIMYLLYETRNVHYRNDRTM